MKRLILDLSCLFVIAFLAIGFGIAIAQPTQSPMEQALGLKLITEVNTTLQCTAAQLTMQAQLTAAQARIKELETKYESKEGK